MDVLGFVTLTVTGFASCAEFGSYAFVHPVIRHLPPESHIRVEQGLLKTFGRVMPVLMTLCVILSISYAVKLSNVESAARVAALASGLIHRRSRIHSCVQRSDQFGYRQMGRRQSTERLEGDKKSVGVLSRRTVLAAADWFCALVFGDDAGLTEIGETIWKLIWKLAKRTQKSEQPTRSLAPFG
jgi:hypothetical protein